MTLDTPSQDADSGYMADGLIGHIRFNFCQKRYTTKRFVDLSGMNGISLPSEGLFNHARRFRLGKI